MINVISDEIEENENIYVSDKMKKEIERTNSFSTLDIDTGTATPPEIKKKDSIDSLETSIIKNDIYVSD